MSTTECKYKAVLNLEPVAAGNCLSPPLSAMTQATGHRQTKRIQRGSAASRPPLVDASSVTGPEPQRVHGPSPAVRAGCRTRGCDGGSGCRIFCPSIPRCLFKPWYFPRACAGFWQVQASGCRLCVPRRPTETTISGGVVGTSSPAWPPKGRDWQNPKSEGWVSISCVSHGRRAGR